MSLARRLLLSASLVLFVFMGVTGLVLDRAFYHSAEQAVHERLKVQAFALLAAADFNIETETLNVEEPLPEPRLASPQSGLYASIRSASGAVIWRSTSSIGLVLPYDDMSDVGEWSFRLLVDQEDHRFFSQSVTVAWEGMNKNRYRYVFQVLEDDTAFVHQVARFRNELWGWLAAVSIILLLAQGFILRWSLQPLREVAADLDSVKAGRKEHLKLDYPAEIQGLTAGINAFIDSERTQRDRYRNTLADLAHSLKTPLAVLKSAIDSQDQRLKDSEDLQEQVDRMKTIVDYQLQRASAAGRTTFGVQTPLLTTVQRLLASMQKVFADKSVNVEVDIDEKLMFAGEEGDLLEIMGNLIENAYKWARHAIRLTANLSGENQAVLLITVEDDGTGIPIDRRDDVVQRGQRADESVVGHGIGLSVVNEIVNVYGGKLSLEDSPALGGARIIVSLPHV